MAATPTETQKLQGEINKIYQSTSPNTILNLPGTLNITSLDGIVFKDETKTIFTHNNPIVSLANARFPSKLEGFNISSSHITSLSGIINWPGSLVSLVINYSPITTLEGVRFPPNLGSLMLTGNKITSLKGITFPNTLSSLYLDGNQITSFESMKFPLSLASITLARNPIDPATVSLLERPTEAVKRAIIRDYPETAQYFEAQREIKEVAMRNLQNHVHSIAQFLQPLIAERKANEEANLTEGKPQLFVNTPNGVQYTIPFTRTLTIQEGAIDYLERNYLLSVMNGWEKIDIKLGGGILEPDKTFAHYNIESEATLVVTGRKLSQHGGRKKTKYNRLKIKKRRSRKHK